MRKEICDFCSGTMPTWTVLCYPIRVILGNTTIDQSPDWAACIKCSNLVKRKDLEGLVKRVSESHHQADSPELIAMHRDVYQKIFDSLISVKEDGLKSIL
jgi:hypothetical protein